MAATPLPLQTKIARDAKKDYKFATASAKFGTTYELSRPSGINNFVEEIAITWVSLTKTEKTSLESSLKSGGSWTVYSYQPCFDTVSKLFRVVAGSFQAQHLGNSNFSATVTLKQVFDLT